MKKPLKPFPDYKWRWATVTCTEGLNDPPVFLGVLRAFGHHEGKSAGDKGLLGELAKVQQDTNTAVNLERDSKRNLVRNSGQYWKSLDLMRESRGIIRLTPFGRRVSNGQVSQSEFAATVIKTLELPNPHIGQDTSPWGAAGLRIRPLQLILEVLAQLHNQGGSDEAYLSGEELVNVVIPLAGAKATVAQQADAISRYRSGALNRIGWPDCAPSANDKRIAREFLMFLGNYGFCTLVGGKKRELDRYYLSGLDPEEIKAFVNMKTRNKTLIEVAQKVQSSNIPNITDRRRVMREVLSRPQQALFRREVLEACKSKCIITGVDISSSLEAAHVIPASKKGADSVDNGFCLRADIHLLFDSGHLRIDPAGRLHLSNAAKKPRNYGKLPNQINLPQHVSIANVRWRWKYC